MKCQLIYRDEYGQTSIVGSSEDLSKLVSLARDKVTDDNMNNALALDEKKREWKSYFVEVLDENGDTTLEGVYGGPTGRGTHLLYQFEKGKAKKTIVADVEAKLFIGTDNKKNYYAENVVLRRPGQTQEVKSVNDKGVESKGCYYIKVL